jgi:hypothetical protein
MQYIDFLEAKKHVGENCGIEPNFIPDSLFDFQKYITNYAIKKGRAAVFMDTGTGKTLIELVIAKNYAQATGKPVLIITPLAVAFQFIKEAGKFGIDDISYSKDGKYTSKIVVCNYERLNKFNSTDFDCVILDESSILKNFDGAIKNEVTSFLKKMKYRYLFTATPSPNDFIELGTSSEALGYMGYTDMLTRFFTNNEDTISPTKIGTKWVLKGHAHTDFFRWVSTWSISMRKPSDLGFPDDKFILPKLIKNYHSVKNDKNMCINDQMLMFNLVAERLTEIREEQKLTVDKRCAKAAQLVENHNISFIWCNRNDEADLLEKLIPNSVNVSGSDSIEKKEEAMLWFLGEKCICNSRNFRYKTATCGNPNTQKIGVKNTETTPLNVSEGINTQTMNCSETNANHLQKNGNQKIQTKDLVKDSESTGLRDRTMKICSPNNVECAQFVDQKNPEIVEIHDCTSTIAIKQEKSEGCYAQIAISDSENLKINKNYYKGHSCTCGCESGIRRIISKPKIFGYGLNLQHCNHTVFFPTFSYEQYYQSIRRFWRFGQKKDVIVDLVFSDGQKKVLDALLIKTEKADRLFSKLNTTLNSDYKIEKREFNKPILLPNFLP